MQYVQNMCWDSLFKDVLCVHPSVKLGEFDGEDDTGDQKNGAASQTKPECVLKDKVTGKFSFFYS